VSGCLVLKVFESVRDGSLDKDQIEESSRSEEVNIGIIGDIFDDDSRVEPRPH
jgi:hypothetical protein